MTDLRAQVLHHLASLRAAGVLFIPAPSHTPGATVNLSSAPAATNPEQFRRCPNPNCGAVHICEFSPSTAIPCECGGELLVSSVTISDIRAERKRCADALIRLAEKCAGAGDATGKVTATGAANHMKALSQWMLEGGK